MSLFALLIEPLQGKTRLSRVVWLYGLVGSLLYGALEFLLDPANAVAMRLYSIGGIVMSAYISVATYRCAFNSDSRFWARTAQIGAVLSLLLLPVFAYFDLTGAFDVALFGVQ
jgi:hypothetical protein